MGNNQDYSKIGDGINRVRELTETGIERFFYVGLEIEAKEHGS